MDDPNPKKVTISVHRRPKRSFIPPRRVSDVSLGVGNDGAAGANGVAGPATPAGGRGSHVKKRDLSPLFSKILKKLEERKEDHQNPGPGGECEDERSKDQAQAPESRADAGFPGMDVDGDSPGHPGEEANASSSARRVSSPATEEYEDDNDNFQQPKEDVVDGTPEFKDSDDEGVFVVPRQLPLLSSARADSQFSRKGTFSQRPQQQQRSQGESSDIPLSQTPATQPSDEKIYYEAVYAKASARKHKKMEFDGFIIVSKGTSVVLKDASGKTVESSGSYKLDSEHIEDGKIFKLGGKEIQICEKLESNPFAKDVILPKPDPAAMSQLAKLPTPVISKPFVSPCTPGTLTATKANKNPANPMFDPEMPGALVMPVLDPSEDVRVVVDPHLSRHLREHQREGVKFLYKCAMDKYYSGAILGDEMGLGKTLQCITLLWTLMKQGPYQRKEVVKRALIIAPSSLVSNWDKEFHRWLGHERVKVFGVNSDHPLKHCPPQCPVIIMSYEMATRSEDALKKMRFDIIVCDEAHKIKNRSGQAYVFLSKLACKRRVLLTGTPVQNDLMELYALVDFANPGVLGAEHEFRKEYEKPIEKYQEPHSSIYEKQNGQAKALQLNNILNNFFLRRTHNVMVRYLPPRVTFVVVCKPSKLQLDLYKQLLSLNIVQDCVTGSGNCSAPLSVILALKKLCNHPNLIHPKSNNIDKEEESVYTALGKCFPPGHRHDVLRVDDSGKMKVLVSLLKGLQGQKVVVVSHYTQTLDLLEDLCKMFSFTFKRLDGSTMAKQRQHIVDQFNNGANEHIFLLSSKAGGLGLNLQGASNIILYDIDWNPAHDIQAMSRCWRPGQKKITHIYRLITSGTIEERIYHRQIAKQDLSGSVMDLLLSNSSVKFSPQDLKDIFSLVVAESCLTHDLIECQCTCDGQRDLNASFDHIDQDDDNDFENLPPPKKKLKSISTMAELNRWEHHGPPFHNLEEQGLVNAAKEVQFVFCSRSIPQDEV